MRAGIAIARPKAGEGFEVQVADSDDERRAVYRFRYQTLVRDMAWGSADADPGAEMLSDDLDAEALQLYLSWRGVVIGAVRLVLRPAEAIGGDLAAALDLARFAEYAPEALSFTDRLMVAPPWQNSRVTALLLGAAYKMARDHGSRFDLTHTAPALVELYEQLGYRRFSDNFERDDGYRVPLVLLTEDGRYLDEIGSPLARLAAAHGKNNGESLGWFLGAFPGYASRPVERTMDENRFWGFLTTRLHQTPLIGIPLLSGLSYDEARRFLGVGTVLLAKDGDYICRAGEGGKEMYVVLSGEVRVRAPGAGPALATLRRGAVFGEMAMLSAEPRSADVIAQGTSELLVLTEEMLKATMATMPAVSAKVLFALSLILCQRLRCANRRWLGATPKETVANEEALVVV